MLKDHKSFVLTTLFQIELGLISLFSFILFNVDIARNHLPYLDYFNSEQIEMGMYLLIFIYVSSMILVISNIILFIQIAINNNEVSIRKIKFILKSNIVCSVIIVLLLTVTIPIDKVLVDTITNEPILIPTVAYILATEIIILTIITYRTFTRIVSDDILGGDTNE